MTTPRERNERFDRRIGASLELLHRRVRRNRPDPRSKRGFHYGVFYDMLNQAWAYHSHFILRDKDT